jgi:D-arginine dehydrogenase
MSDTFDFLIVGAGIAGASLGAELARRKAGRIAIVEMEAQPGYHTTGRSAAIFAPTYGPQAIRALTRASDPFFQNPDDGFSDGPLLSPRSILMLARPDQIAALETLTAAVAAETETATLTEAEMQDLCPLLRAGYACAGLLDTTGHDIDVAALHQGYLRQFGARGGVVLTGHRVEALQSHGTGWSVETSRGALCCSVLVNAAGAWAEEIGRLAGAETIGLTPKRRTALTVAAPSGLDLRAMPMLVDVEEAFYVKPEVGQLLLSPADETPSAPCDAQPEEWDIALCIDRVQRALDLPVQRIASRWAGLRSFAGDGLPVIGLSTRAANFFWMAGQGGYGIQTAPAIAAYAAACLAGNAGTENLLRFGFDPGDVSPARFADAESGNRQI